MRALLQRVRNARVVVAEQVVGAIRAGLVIFLGVAVDDEPRDAEWLAAKVAELRIFDGPEGAWVASVRDLGGEVLAVSQFTLHADSRKGRRPSFHRAAPAARAVELYSHFTACLRGKGLKVETGRFGAEMQVELVNDGPVTIWLDSRER